MKNAIGRMNIALEKKTTWNTKDIMHELASICCGATFTSTEAATAFQQTCYHFELHVRNRGITSMGHNQFKTWLEEELAQNTMLGGNAEASIRYSKNPAQYAESNDSDVPWY